MTGATYALQYDLLNDFVPVALISTYPFVLVAKKTMPANDLKGLIAWLKANPDKASVGTGGNGSNTTGQNCMETLVLLHSRRPAQLRAGQSVRDGRRPCGARLWRKTTHG